MRRACGDERVWNWSFDKVTFGGFLFFALIGALFYFAILMALKHEERIEKLPPKQKKIARNEQKFGELRREVVCPQCQTRGNVHMRKASKKGGISGAKATGALITGGVSLLATGLSRKDNGNQAYCTNCGSDWFIG